MNNWKPSYQRGNTVKCTYPLPRNVAHKGKLFKVAKAEGDTLLLVDIFTRASLTLTTEEVTIYRITPRSSYDSPSRKTG